MKRPADNPNGQEPRPAVSVVVPFGGDERAADDLARSLATLDLRPGDELIVADNTGEAGMEDRLASLLGGALRAGPVRPRIVAARRERSSYHARNEGARAASREWLLFIDADCKPTPGLLGRYFAEPVPEGCGILAGAIVGLDEQRSLLARYTRSRRFYDSERGLGATGEPEGGAAPAGNLLVRRSAFERVGGFVEGIRSAGDYDFCWRVQAAGLRLVRRPDAAVAHRHREDLPSFLGMIARYGAGANWMNRRYPGCAPRWPLLAGVAGSARDILVNLVQGRPEEALFRALDAIGLVAYNLGYAGSNEIAA